MKSVDRYTINAPILPKTSAIFSFTKNPMDPPRKVDSVEKNPRKIESHVPRNKILKVTILSGIILELNKTLKL